MTTKSGASVSALLLLFIIKSLKLDVGEETQNLSLYQIGTLLYLVFGMNMNQLN